MLPSTKPGGVAAGMGETLHKALRNRLIDVDEYNGDFGASLQQRLHGLTGAGDDDIRRERKNFVERAFGVLDGLDAPSRLEREVVADDPAALFETFPQRRDATLAIGVRIRCRHQHDAPFWPLASLYIGRTRPWRNTKPRKRDELPSVHWMIEPPKPMET
jgi:hypothetical protein